MLCLLYILLSEEKYSDFTWPVWNFSSTVLHNSTITLWQYWRWAVSLGSGKYLIAILQECHHDVTYPPNQNTMYLKHCKNVLCQLRENPVISAIYPNAGNGEAGERSKISSHDFPRDIFVQKWIQLPQPETELS